MKQGFYDGRMLITPMSLLDKLCNPQAEEAWHRFVDLYTPLLYHWIKELNIPAADTSDLLQDVFVQLYRKLPEYQQTRRGHFHGWLHSVLRNKAYEWKRKQNPSHAAIDLDVASSSLSDHDEQEYRQYLVNRLLQLMKDSFPEATWRACWENVVEGRSAEEVAMELGITVNMVYLAKSRVLRKLRQEIVGLVD